MNRSDAINPANRNFTHKTLKNADGTPLRARRNGATQTWKTRPEEFRLPAKRGLKETFQITEKNADEWYVAGQELDVVIVRRVGKVDMIVHRVATVKEAEAFIAGIAYVAPRPVEAGEFTVDYPEGKSV